MDTECLLGIAPWPNLSITSINQLNLNYYAKHGNQSIKFNYYATHGDQSIKLNYYAAHGNQSIKYNY